MYYVDFYCLFRHSEKDWDSILEAVSETPHPPELLESISSFIVQQYKIINAY